MNTYKTSLFLLLILSIFNACDLNTTLTEAQAKKAGEYMLTLKNQEDPGNAIKFVKWKAFIQSGDTNAELWAVFQTQQEPPCVMSGSFNFVKPKDGDWTLSHYYFHSERGDSCVWSKDFVRYVIPR